MSETAPTEGGQGTAATSSSAALASTPAAPAQPASQQVAATPAQPQNTPVSWLPDADELTAGYVQNKGWDTPAKAVQSYQNLEKLLGADKANNAIIIPKEGADAKEWQAVYDRLGRPTGPDGYKVAVPEGGNAEFQNQVLAKMHELGLTKSQGEALVSWYNEQNVSAMTASTQARAAEFQKQDAALRTEWGNAYTQNLAVAQTAFRGLGLDAESVDKISAALGHQATMQLLHTIGSRMSEPAFETGAQQSGYGSALTPAQAKATIQARMADKTWVQKYQSGGMNSAEFQEMQRLQAWANPE